MADDFACKKGDGVKIHWGFTNGTTYCHQYTSNTGTLRLFKVSGKVKKGNLCGKCFTKGFMEHEKRDEVLTRLGITIAD